METELPASADDVAARLGDTGYLCDDALATVTFLALRMQRPLLLEGEPGHREDRAGRGDRRGARPAAGPAAVLRGDRRDPGALRLGLPAPDPAPARARGGRLRGRRRGGREEPVRRAVPARAAGAGRAPAEPGGAARRRGGPRRRRVRGVPARGAVDVPGQHPRARHRRRRDAAGRGADLQPHPRAARRPQATLPLPLDRAPRPGARGADRPLPRTRGLRGAGPAGRRGRAAAAGRRAPEAARGRRDPRLGSGPAPPRHRHAGPRVVGPHPRRAGQVPRGPQRVQQALDQMLRA